VAKKLISKQAQY